MLDERGETGQSHLQRLFFYDGAEARGCRVPGVLAFTQPGSHVVYVCSQWFRETFTTNPSKVEAVIIHESLHSLGLGENPPKSHEITARVMERCCSLIAVDDNGKMAIRRGWTFAIHSTTLPSSCS